MRETLGLIMIVLFTVVLVLLSVVGPGDAFLGG